MNATTKAENCYDVVIVGGGFSGVMVAINVAQTSPQPVRIAIVERNEEVGRGVAYAATLHDALLNVPAGSMGAFADRPDDFANWLRSRGPTATTGIDASAYYPRRLYGSYLGSLLADARRAGYDITSVAAHIVDYMRVPDGVALITPDGRCVAVGRQVVFALGGQPPADIGPAFAELSGHPRYVPDPWAFLKRQDFAARGEIVIVGSGLTALDVIASFARSGYTNPLVVVSRGGRFPRAHFDHGGAPINPIPADRKPVTIREIVGLVRTALRAATADGSDWRAVLDGLRPAVQGLWLGLSVAERRRYLRHVRAIYDPHRHRAPATVLAIKDRLVAAGQLETIAGRIVAVQALPDAIEVTLRNRADGSMRSVAAAQIINCGGPGSMYAASPEPLVAKLFANGEVVADPTGLGVQALRSGRLVAANGSPQSDLYTIGWPMRGVLLETTAVRELRVQARILADELIGSFPSPAPGPSVSLA